jgi:hypothetical protein
MSQSLSLLLSITGAKRNQPPRIIATLDRNFRIGLT